MHNMVYLIGRLVEEPIIKELEDGRNSCVIKVAVQRSFKNEEGIYEVDVIPCKLWNGVAQHTCEYCNKGDLVGLKGRIESVEDKLIVIVDKISFLSSKQIEEKVEGEF